MQMKKVLFLSPYPYDENMKEGMISRVKSIDNKVSDVPRTYLLVTLCKGNSCRKIGLADVYVLNIVTSLFKILKLFMETDVVYCQSICSIRWSWLFCWLFRGKKTFFLDVHGVVPEEERYFQKKFIHSCYMDFIQGVIFRVVDYTVCVTQRMIDEYMKKDKDYKKQK